MARFPQPQGTKGSLRWIQYLVNKFPEVLSDSIGPGQMEWLSPLVDDGFAEYRDQAFLDRLGIKLTKRRLDDFWPVGGPQWDALGRTASGVTILVEAKAHVAELLSSPTQATAESADMIRRSLSEVATALGARPGTDWSQRFYQYANRLAYAWFLTEANKIPTRLAFIYFIGDSDMNGPCSRREWEAALIVLHEALGLRGRLQKYVSEIFIDIRPSTPKAI